MVQLQTEVQDLQAAVAHMQQSNDERMGVLKDLVQQTADSVNKMSVAVQTMQQKLTAQQEAAGTKVDQVSGQVQSLNDSLDEVKARLNAMDRALQSVQGQQQSINAALQNMAPPNPANVAPGTAAPPDAGAPGPVAGSNLPPIQPSNVPQNPGKPSAGVPFPATQGPYANSTPLAPIPAAGAGVPPVADIYRTALGDYMAAKYTLATSEFGQVIQGYPDDSLAGNAYYYLGEIDYRNGKFAAAIKNYDHVVDQYPRQPKGGRLAPAQGFGIAGAQAARRRHRRTARPHPALPYLAGSLPGPHEAQRHGRPGGGKAHTPAGCRAAIVRS